MELQKLLLVGLGLFALATCVLGKAIVEEPTKEEGSIKPTQPTKEEEATTTEKPNGGDQEEKKKMEDEDVTDDLLKKECPDAETAFDKLMCANFIKQNVAKRNKIKGEDHIEIIDGDLVLEPEQHRRQRRAAIDKRWPTSSNGNVYIPYVFSTSQSSVQRAFNDAIQDWNRLTCIRWRPRTNEANYISVIDGSGCYTYAGMSGGRQVLSLQANSYCSNKGVAIHEMMHVVGFLHTQSRRDRDQFITIHYNNIASSLWRQFNEHNYGEAHVYGVSYDKQSVMHYGRRSGAFRGFSITSKQDPNEELGQRNGFSPKDLLGVNRMYCPHLVRRV